jgi:hypothetical protein
VVAQTVEAVRADDRSRAAPQELNGALPQVLDYWGGDPRTGKPNDGSASSSGEHGRTATGAPPDPFRYLTALRQNPPGTKSWG